METILARGSNLTQNVSGNSRNYIISYNVSLIIIFFTDINAHPFMKTALIISAIANFVWSEFAFDSALVANGAMNKDALALDANSNYAKKVLSAPVGVTRAILFLVMATNMVVTVMLIAKY